MAGWKYTFRHGKTLRETIDLDDNFKTLVELDRGLKAFIPQIKDEYMEHDFEELATLIADDVEFGEEKLTEFIDEEWNESLQDYVNDKLRWFYDLCDGWKVWVSID